MFTLIDNCPERQIKRTFIHNFNITDIFISCIISVPYFIMSVFTKCYMSENKLLRVVLTVVRFTIVATPFRLRNWYQSFAESYCIHFNCWSPVSPKRRCLLKILHGAVAQTNNIVKKVVASVSCITLQFARFIEIIDRRLWLELLRIQNTSCVFINCFLTVPHCFQ